MGSVGLRRTSYIWRAVDVVALYGATLHFRGCIAIVAQFPYAALDLKVAGLIPP